MPKGQDQTDGQETRHRILKRLIDNYKHGLATNSPRNAGELADLESLLGDGKGKDATPVPAAPAAPADPSAPATS